MRINHRVMGDGFLRWLNVENRSIGCGGLTPTRFWQIFALPDMVTFCCAKNQSFWVSVSFSVESACPRWR